MCNELETPERLGSRLTASVFTTRNPMATPRRGAILYRGCAIAVIISLSMALASGALGDCALKERWFFFWGDLANDGRAAEFSEVVNDASAAGYNGVVLECDAGNAFLWSEDKVKKCQKMLQFCSSKGVKVIPQIWSVGYGSMLRHSPDLVETAPIRDLPYVVRNGKIVFAGAELPVDNAGLEESVGGTFHGWDVDAPGKVSFVDRDIVHGGRQSVRFGPARTHEGHARLFRKILVAPFKRYRFSAWVRVEEGDAGKLKKELRLAVRGGGETLGYNKILEQADFRFGEWRQYGAEFYAYTNSAVYVYVGAWGNTEARFWVDDVKVKPLPLTKVPRGAGAPFRVKRADGSAVFEERRDYLPPPAMTDWRMKQGESPIEFEVPEGSLLKEGDALLVDASVPIPGYIYDKSPFGQYAACMSDPALYRYFERSAAAVERIFHPEFWMLSMDEIRAGGTCEACMARNTDMAHILGDCVTRQAQTIQTVHPGATVCMWSDMIDPVHNAGDGYYSCRGTFYGVWNFIPKDVVAVCWWCAKRDESPPFFEGLGMRTMAAAFYDAKSLDGSRSWMESCARTPHCLGMMYTTWKSDYGMLRAFGEMLKGDGR